MAYRDGLSDERAMEAVRFDLRWKIALDLPIDDPGFHATSLVRFRARLLLRGKERLVFERSVELATELGLLSGSAEQIVDSTPMLGAAAVQDTAVLVRAAVRELIAAVSSVDGEAAGELRRVLRFDYSKPRDKPEGDWQDPDTRMRLLTAVALDAERALRAVAACEELMAVAAVAEAAGVLREILGQEFEVSDDDVPRVRRGRGVRQIVSANDPEMRDGRKTPARRFTGYKVHAAVRIVIAVSLSPGNEHDGHHAGPLIDQQPEEMRPERVIGDTPMAMSRFARSSSSARSRCSPRFTAALPRMARFPRSASRSTLTVTLSPARRARPPRSKSEADTSRTSPASASPGSPGRTANPARSDSSARPAGNETSASDAAKTYAKPRSKHSPIQPSASTRTAPGHESSGCSD